MSRLTLLHINIIGAVVAVIVGAALYFTVITGAQENVRNKETSFRGVETRANDYDKAKRELASAETQKAETERSYNIYNAKYMPRLNYTNNVITTMMTVWWPNAGRSWPERFIRGFRAHMARERKVNGIVWDNPQVLTLPSYGPDPNAIEMGQTNGTLRFGPYAMQVHGPNYQALINHFRSWNRALGIGMPVVEGDVLSGNSPRLNGTYTVTFTIIVKDKIPPRDTVVTGGAGGAAGGGMLGGVGGGVPGGAGAQMQMMMRAGPTMAPGAGRGGGGGAAAQAPPAADTGGAAKGAMPGALAE